MPLSPRNTPKSRESRRRVNWVDPQRGEARARRCNPARAQQSRIAARREIDARLAGEEDMDKRDNERYQSDSKYFERHLRTMKTTLQREVNNDPHQYLECLYQELVLWKNANRPAVSPLEHPLVVLQSLDTTAKKICQEIRFTVGHVPLMEKFSTFNAVILHLYGCVTDLQIALYEEDLVDPEDTETFSKYSTLEERHGIRRLKMFDGNLQWKYDAAGL
ncbi:hypothetical protein AAF712_016048 [Marasmius tenuissimus]|uniref:Uncharacterized protein n=1 Tax=Marasmius tenuissimus TaxID=585030 RepID=A0ABR2Z8T3_9AGAR